MNCSDYEILPDNTTIVCFTFTFDYHEAIGAAGGVFAFAVFGIRAVIEIIVWLKNKHGVEFSKLSTVWVLSLIFIIYICFFVSSSLLRC